MGAHASYPPHVNKNDHFQPKKKGENNIVIKPGPGVDLAKGPGPGSHGSTRKIKNRCQRLIKKNQNIHVKEFIIQF